MLPHRSVANAGPAKLLGHLHRGPRPDPPLDHPPSTPEARDPERDPWHGADPDAPCCFCGARVFQGQIYCRRCAPSWP
jgi:hypothetical protein